MEQTFHIERITIGFHPEGYKIDRIASPIGPYTRWKVEAGCVWYNPKPVLFEELPLDGWIKTDEFDWEGVEAPADLTEPRILRSNT